MNTKQVEFDLVLMWQFIWVMSTYYWFITLWSVTIDNFYLDYKPNIYLSTYLSIQPPASKVICNDIIYYNFQIMVHCVCIANCGKKNE